MNDPPAGRVGPAARALGYAGLLPPAAAVVLIALREFQVGVALAVFYPLAILSFLGGSWWGLAMRRDADQGALAAVLLITVQVGWVLVAIGVTVLLTLLVDRRLVATGAAPAGWLRLRVPLSLGLGGLTILAGALVGAPSLYI